jgi:prepilin-type N-terminal cleavage/methylation domain-containing protein
MKILRPGRAQGRRGFTLIEMTIVLVIMLAFLAMSVPFFTGFSASTGLKTSEREIMTVLRTARSYAVSRNDNYSAVFNGGVIPNTYVIINSNGTVLDKTFSLPNGVTYTAAITTVTFTPNGGLTGLAAPNTVIIRNNKNPDKTITVNRITGALE